MHKLEDFGVTKYVDHLDSGVKVVLFYKPDTPISTNVLFLTGSRFDSVGKEGLSHFIEHIIFKKTKKFASEVEVFKYLEEIGGVPNAFTSAESLGIDINVALKKDYRKVVTFIDEVLNNTAFDKSQVEMEKDVILDEKRRYESSPEYSVQDISDVLFFQGTDISKSIIGSEKSIRSISWEDLRDKLRSDLNPKDSIILVAGDIQMGDLLSYFNKVFTEKRSETSSLVKPTPLPIIRKEKILIKKFTDISQVYLRYGFRSCSLLDDNIYVLSLIGAVLGNGFSSSLMTKLRVENGLVYNVGVSVNGFRDAGAWMVYSATSKGNLQKLLDIVSEEFGRVYNGKLNEQEIKLAKNKLIKSQILKLQTSYQWVGAHSQNVLYWDDDFPTVVDYLNEIERITMDDIKRAGKKYFKPESWYLALCGDIEEKDIKVNY